MNTHLFLRDGLNFDLIENEQVDGRNIVLIGLNKFKREVALHAFENKSEKEAVELFDRNFNLEAYLKDISDKLDVKGKPLYDDSMEDFTYFDSTTSMVYTMQVERVYEPEADEEILIIIF